MYKVIIDCQDSTILSMFLLTLKFCNHTFLRQKILASPFCACHMYALLRRGFEMGLNPRQSKRDAMSPDALDSKTLSVMLPPPHCPTRSALPRPDFFAAPHQPCPRHSLTVPAVPNLPTKHAGPMHVVARCTPQIVLCPEQLRHLKVAVSRH